MCCSGTADTPAISASPLPFNFLGLPIQIRNNIYKQILVLPHPLHIFQDPGCPLESFAPEKPGSWLALTYVSRQISGEAMNILYSMNRFTFQEIETACRPGTLLESFLNCIGPKNFGILSHLCINFPVTEQISSTFGETRLTDGLRRLQLIRQSCANLQTLEMLTFGQYASILVADDQMNDKSIRKSCLEVDAQIKEIATLDTIVVRIYNNGTPAAIREFLQGLGWIVKFGDA
ncbi:uncharacterized protein BO88DRAFT_409095 [Aspergillus vadensis CBS 113365]|uniref:Uncharacterized protein n=1 Tax=Aspergillus vadensis (strain CBS 113365 / IMI 142717 / IBT 24658) TaxID=1448311 RepID=A0A319BAX7_ASPVC|nr:hypothetical protein BO88DRAFT_409095 [Aspergillus vadensis CBS 113365]PYH63543.1 hypothetical protein BO88DRAFT_409095 [Aspergillus vadensis CBS 113365]